METSISFIELEVSSAVCARASNARAEIGHVLRYFAIGGGHLQDARRALLRAGRQRLDPIADRLERNRHRLQGASRLLDGHHLLAKTARKGLHVLIDVTFDVLDLPVDRAKLSIDLLDLDRCRQA
jgi:hypothetical protein